MAFYYYFIYIFFYVLGINFIKVCQIHLKTKENKWQHVNILFKDYKFWCHGSGCVTSSSLLFCYCPDIFLQLLICAISVAWQCCAISHTCRTLPLPYLFTAVSTICCQLITIHVMQMLSVCVLPACDIVLRTKRRGVCSKTVSLTGLKLVISWSSQDRILWVVSPARVFTIQSDFTSLSHSVSRGIQQTQLFFVCGIVFVVYS